VKLFQIEEPDGSPGPVDGPGASVGIHLAAEASIATALGGNAEILGRASGATVADTLLALRGRAEKLLGRPVTHAVIAIDDKPEASLFDAAEAAGLTVLRLMPASEAAALAGAAPAEDAAALGAAILAEDAAPASVSFEREPMPKMTFIERDGTRREVDAPLGLSVLEIAHKHGIDLEGACEGSLACSTCHVVVDGEWYDLLKEATEDEEDMLDLAFGLTQTSRLGCQIIMSDELDGLTVALPAGVRNMMGG